MPPRKFDHDEIERLFLEGLNSEQIAKKLGCSAATASSVIRTRGHERKPGPKAPPLPDPLDLVGQHEIEGISWRELARRNGVDEKTIRRHAAQAPEVADFRNTAIDEGVETLNLRYKDGEHLGDVNQLLRARGLDPQQWIVHGLRVNEWQAPGEGGEPQTMKQLKAYLRRKVTAEDLLQPIEPKPLKLPPAPKAKPRPERVHLIYGDNQEPFGEPAFKRLLIRLARQLQPDTLTDLGDGMDLPTISRHAPRGHDPSVRECAASYGQFLWDMRRAAPSADYQILADNHVSDRLERYQLDRARELYGVSPVQLEGMRDDLEPLWSVRRLLRLDEMGITYVDPGSKHYAYSYRELIPGELVAIHGYRTGKNAAEQFVKEWDCSVVYGHLHTTSGLYVTDKARMGVGQRRRLWGIPVGCVASNDRPDYAPGADHQQSALLIREWPDGRWTWTPLDYRDGILAGGDIYLTDELEAAA